MSDTIKEILTKIEQCTKTYKNNIKYLENSIKKEKRILTNEFNYNIKFLNKILKDLLKDKPIINLNKKNISRVELSKDLLDLDKQMKITLNDDSEHYINEDELFSNDKLYYFNYDIGKYYPTIYEIVFQKDTTLICHLELQMINFMEIYLVV